MAARKPAASAAPDAAPSPTPIRRGEIDLDAVFAQREEATGDEANRFAFFFAGQRWSCADPLMATDEWREELRELADDGDDEDAMELYLGAEQWEKFREAGGQVTYVYLALRLHQQEAVAETREGRPTRPNRSSRRSRRH